MAKTYIPHIMRINIINVKCKEKKPMELREIKPILESAFKPYRCIVKLEDYEEYISFRIYNKNGGQIIYVPEFNAKDENDLTSKINDYKHAIIGMGLNFD
ncbi:MAG: hypothetical protein A2W74_05865 [Planctomycetes bacterium RIFCSPLOWO2_12_38_17]|nr:MAG: hypothetical protein A2W74_05865 [Planctomycetes bacterium RIFCSPLOWO2_12_38_17]